MAKLQSTENVSREMQQQSTEMLSHKRLCKRNRLFSGAWRTQRRRGVLLLVSLVLLVMFLMLGVTFVLTAGNFRRSSEAYQRMLERPSADLPERSGDLLDSVAHDLVRGTSNPDSPFAKENLLEDLYGRPALRGKVTSALGGQLKELTVTADADFTLSTVQDYYAGLVLTMLTGDCAGKSTRIVGWDGGNELTVVAFPRSKNPANGDLFLVNGRPFSGDGSDTSGRQLNEDYDKADANNPWLASKETADTVTPSYESLNVETSDPNPSVDNDGDGQKDSVWIDTGLPLQLQPDGTYVKPLVAMMVRDLDGRVNLNVHGSAAQLSAMASADKPLGQGYGPAEIDPFHALDIRASSDGAEFDITNFLERRLSDAGMPAGGTTGDGTVPNDQNRQQDFSGYYHYGSEEAVVTPLDPHGIAYAEADETTGAITYKADANNNLTDDFSGTTYALEVDTAQGVAPGWHTPYAPNDLERILRFSDADAEGINSRLYEDLALCLTGGTEIDPDDLKKFRERITTESWDLPVAGLGLPRELYSKVDTLINGPPGLSAENKTKLQKFLLAGGHITDLLKARILLENPDYQNAPLQDKLNNLTQQNFDSNFPSVRVAVESFVTQLPGLGPGLTRGTRFNVNRLLGNGVDDDKDDPNAPGYDVVDDVGEVGTETITAPGYGGIKFDHDGNGTSGQPEDKRARQHYAQQLYLLLMLLSDGLEGQSCFTDVTSGSDEQRRLLARRLAQFAVNAVDYRDPDSIMTGFEYDADPFDATGWDSDSNIATDESNDGLDNDGDGVPDNETAGSDLDRGIVWGCEAPVAALSGTLALHDLRLKDLSVGGETTALAAGSTFPPNVSDYNDPATLNALILADPDYDQYGPPEGSLFLQVYALPQPSGAKLPAEFFNGGSRDLELSKTTPSSNDPVWRVVISEPHVAGKTQQGTSGAGAPIVNQLRDQGAAATDVTGVSSVWSPLTTLLPDATNPLQLQFQAPGVASNTNVDPTIALDRVIYFANPLSTTPKLNQAYVANTLVSLAPGSAIHLGPRQNTNIRQAGTVQNTVSCDVVCEVDSPGTWNGGLGKVGMSISEPVVSSYYNDSALSRVSGAADPSAEDYSAPADTPFDKTNATPVGKLIAATPSLLESDRIEPVGTMSDTAGGMNEIDVHRPQIGGTLQNYATAFLQRLADPTQAYDATSNPYLTVDLMPIDLTVYNGDGDAQAAAVINQPGTNGITIADPVYAEHLGTDERGWRNRATLNDPVGSATKNMSISAPSSFVSSSNPAPFWPNRPFVSQYELLMVPASEPGKLMLELGSHQESSPKAFTDGFPHLLNFFFQSSSEPQLGRIFDYLHVPSRYAGTQVSLDPGSSGSKPGFAPPFNVISTYREPGRVNLNTIEDSEVWKAVMHGEPSSDPSALKPHQGPAHSSLQDTYHGPGEVRGVDGESVAMPLLSSSLGFEDTSSAGVNDNPFLRYQPINRMGNLTTTRSNVYAVWMTLGFFETNSQGNFSRDADGNLREAGGSGLERHRAFYMIDRSIPVGYENGHDHNTEDVFRVKRYIE